MSQLPPRLAELGSIAEEAGRIARQSRKSLKSELKPDGSIVTNCDRDVETWLRGELVRFVPETGVWGEEFGFEAAGPGGLWVVDPIDGTSNFSFGSPLWGVSVALLVGPVVAIAAIYLPDLDELFVCEKGAGAYFNGSVIPHIPPGRIQKHELVSYGDGLPVKYPDLELPGKMRLSGAFVVDGTFTVLQRFRGLVGHRERLYDIAGCVGLAIECGADVRYADGDVFDLVELSRPIKIQKPWIIFPWESGFAG